MTLVCAAMCIGGPTALHAGAWLPSPGETKLIYNLLSETAPDRPLVRGRVREPVQAETVFDKLLLEYGLSDTLAVQAIATQGRRGRGALNNKDRLIKFGFLVDVPQLRTGLLPPLLFQGMRALLPDTAIRHDKRASFGVAALAGQTRFNNRREARNGHDTELALADKISFGRFSVLQNIENTRTIMENIEWQQSLYRFELAWDNRLSLGTEAYFFDDRNSSFAALTHIKTLGWHMPRRNMRVKLSHGNKRQTGFVKSDITALEIEFRF